MDKTEARNILKTIQDECNSHEDCRDCAFYEEGYGCVAETNPYAYDLEEGQLLHVVRTAYSVTTVKI